MDMTEIHPHTEGSTTEADVVAAKAWKALEPVAVKCSTCGHATMLMPHPIEVDGVAHEQRWECDCVTSYITTDGVKLSTKEWDKGEVQSCECNAKNVIEGAPGIPGEGALNPAASALTKDQLLEAAVRQGLIEDSVLTDDQRAAIARVRGQGIVHQIDVGGGVDGTGAAGGKVV